MAHQQDESGTLMNATRPTALLSIIDTLLLVGGCSKVRLMEAMLGSNEPNEKTLGQMIAVGGGSVARITVEHNAEETVLSSAVIMVGRAGEFEIALKNLNPQNHLMLVAPSDGGKIALDLPPLYQGRTRLHLGTPGMYMFADAMGDHMGRGMMGMILVEGEVPAEAKLDGPKQPRP